MKRRVILFTAALLIMIGGGAVALPSILDFEQRIICASGSGAVSMPADLCMWHLQTLSRRDELEAFDRSHGISYVFEISDTDKRRELLDWLIGKGADVNAIAPDGLTPLNAAVLLNDAPLVTYLLMHGADPGRRDKRSGLDAPGLLDRVTASRPAEDRDGVRVALERSASPVVRH